MTEFKKIDSQANSLNKEFLKSVHEAFKSSGGGFVSLLSRKGSSVIAGSSAKRDQLLSLVYVKIKDFLVNVLWRFIAENLPRSFEPLWDFFKISMSNLTVPILIQLAYRICVFFAATKIIPILQPIQHHDSPLSTPTTTEPQIGKLTKTDSRQDRGGRVRSPMKNKNASTPSRLIYLYSPCIIIAVYTNLMIQYNDDLDKQNHFWNWVKMKLRGDLSIQTAAEIASDDVHSWQFWNWINIFSVLLLYLSELINHDPEDSSLADHWA
ncbi:DEKNAAC102056 [Brettanomyces naardenensis]|uniref:DEKNAAC102056 n=1 Tax=Brettanomyces naardenensis TaxID=13370 RepID=A0A448YJT6_BRENA|nr:DEKNAAC102056 [Brettanomyces naardenensis]